MANPKEDGEDRSHQTASSIKILLQTENTNTSDSLTLCRAPYHIRCINVLWRPAWLLCSSIRLLQPPAIIHSYYVCTVTRCLCIFCNSFCGCVTLKLRYTKISFISFLPNTAKVINTQSTHIYPFYTRLPSKCISFFNSILVSSQWATSSDFYIPFEVEQTLKLALGQT